MKETQKPFDPKKKSKYASKKIKQAGGVYSKKSPFYTESAILTVIWNKLNPVNEIN